MTAVTAVRPTPRTFARFARHARARALLAGAALALLHGCSDGGGDASDGGDELDPGRPRIVGSVIDAATLQPVRDAVISTNPVTQEIRTGADGTFTLVDAVGEGGEYVVFARHIAYDSDQRRVAAGRGDTARAEFSLDAKPAGIVADRTTVQFAPTASRETLRLSSAVPGTGFSTIVADPWLSVVPDGGRIVDGETVLLALSVDRDALAGAGPVASEVVVNTDNGTGSLVLSVLVDPPPGDRGDAPGPTSADCRRPDVLRVGADNPDAPLIQFPNSVELDAGTTVRREVLVPDGNAFYVDSIEVASLGTLVVDHVSGGPAATSLELFDLDAALELRTLVFVDGRDGAGGRARFEYGVVPGIYCYYLGGTDAGFVGDVPLDISLGLRPPR